MTFKNNNAPMFSIIVPTYNRGGRIAVAINSILNQEFRDYEIIIVDDGSTDDTRKVLEELMQNNSRIRYFYKKNEERSIARNYGIERASGKYVGFLDSDDIQYPNHLKVAYELLKRNEYPEVGHVGYELIDEHGNVLLVRNDFDGSYKEKLIHENTFHGNAIFIRSDVLSQVKFIQSPFAILSEDWYLWLLLAARYKFRFDNTVTSGVVHHDERSLMNVDADKLIANTNIIVECLMKDAPFLKEYKNKTSYHFANHYTFLTLILALTKKRRRDTFRYLLKAIKYDPSVVFRKRFLASIKHLF